MARLERIEYPGAFYHVTNRGNRKQSIFLGDEDLCWFINCLREAHERYKIIVHVFCLMDNHYHLLIETPRGNLSRAMHLVNLKYASYFNLKHSLKGHTFQSRYWAIVVQAEQYVRELAPYIHLNPVRAQLVSRPEEYRWSNYRAYLGLSSPESWTCCSYILGIFGDSLVAARANYQRETLSRIGQATPEAFLAAQKTGILGSPDFKARLQKVIPTALQASPRNASLKPSSRPTLAQIHKTAESVIGEGNRLVRKVAIFISHEYTDLPLRVICEFFSIGESGIADVCRRLRKETIHNQTLSGIIEEIEGRLTRESQETDPSK